jgi:hypothetical protein
VEIIEEDPCAEAYKPCPVIEEHSQQKKRKRRSLQVINEDTPKRRTRSSLATTPTQPFESVE